MATRIRSRSADVEAALRWITSLLREREVPFQAAGGLAVRAHGGRRALVDVDLYLPEGALSGLGDAVASRTTTPPRRYVGERWDCYFCELHHGEVEIELAEASRTRFRRSPDDPWHDADVDFGSPATLEAYGVELPVMPRDRLLACKRILARAVDLLDVADLEGRLPGPTEAPLRALGRGDFCLAWLLGDDRVVRAPRHRDAARALEREACLLERIAGDLPAPVPRPGLLWPGGVDRPLSVHRRVPGAELTGRHWRALPEPARERSAAALGRFLAVLHGLAPEAAAGCGLPRIGHDETERLLERLAGSGAPIPPSLASALARRLEAAAESPGGGSVGPAILHADVSPGHVLVDPEDGALEGIIDWGDARIGDPARDFIFVYEDWGPDFLARVLEGYGPAEPRAFRARVGLRYLADQLAWTLDAVDAGRTDDAAHGVAALEAALQDFPVIEDSERDGAHP